MTTIDSIFGIIILILSVVVHEVAHGYMALALGDPTAKYADRLTLNPIKHLDLYGSIIVPLLLIISNTGIVLGWAKPVPFNPYNLRNQKWGEALVAIAGPISNLLLALIFGIIIRVGLGMDLLNSTFLNLAGFVVLINITLAIFNLVPIPPLDGSKILFAILPYRWLSLRQSLEKFGFILVLIFVFFFWSILSPVVSYFFKLATGLVF
jgi:Zn-dependent protease